MQDRKMTDQVTGGGKCRTEILRTKSQGLKMQSAASVSLLKSLPIRGEQIR